MMAQSHCKMRRGRNPLGLLGHVQQAQLQQQQQQLLQQFFATQQKVNNLINYFLLEIKKCLFMILETNIFS